MAKRELGEQNQQFRFYELTGDLAGMDIRPPGHEDGPVVLSGVNGESFTFEGRLVSNTTDCRIFSGNYTKVFGDSERAIGEAVLLLPKKGSRQKPRIQVHEGALGS